jgi:Protein of unknown function (DUF3443).
VTDPSTGLPLSECLTFADGWAWGSVDTADVTLGGRTIQNLVLQVVGDPASGTAPSACSTGNGPPENDVASFGANGTLGVGYFLEDCGSACSEQVAGGGAAPFYACSGTGGDQGCRPVTASTTSQPANPIARLSADNNGLELRFPAVGPSPLTSLTGTLLFGIGTQPDNGLGTATLLAVDPNDGTISTTYKGTTFPGSFIDSGSTAYYFPDSTIAPCSSSGVAPGFYCPPGPVAASAVIAGAGGGQAQVELTVGNAEQLFTSSPQAAVFPTLAGTIGELQLPDGTFDWGMPFFYGRSVFMLFESRSLGSTTGPAVGF